MKIKELNEKLNSLGIAESEYYIHGLFGSSNDNDKLSLVRILNGQKIEYEVYFKEKGIKGRSIIFETEDEACKYFYDRMKSWQNI